MGKPGLIIDAIDREHEGVRRKGRIMKLVKLSNGGGVYLVKLEIHNFIGSDRLLRTLCRRMQLSKKTL